MGCAAALATIEVMSEPGFMDNVRARGEQLRSALTALMEPHPTLVQVRGPGLMVGTVFDDPGRVPRVLEHCLGEGHLILMNAGTYGNVIRWMPPLVVTAQEIDEGVQAFSNALKAAA
jgi:acetylornithine/succinyldiaminopimelate/putrescine aminotransferase